MNPVFQKLAGTALLLITGLFLASIFLVPPSARLQILGVCAAAALLAVFAAWLYARSFTARLDSLKLLMEGLLDEQPAALPPSAADDEFGALAESLRRMAPRARAMADRLRLEGARSDAILASMVEGVLAVDGDLRVSFCNDSFARAVGAREPIPDGLPLVRLVRDPGLLDMLSTVLETGESQKRRLQWAPEGHSFEVQATPLGRAGGVLAILHDVTDLERLERIRKDFVANVSHELRTPLAAIRGYAETLLEGALDDRENRRKFVEIIQAHAIRLNNIASDLLALSELDSGRSPQPARVSIRESLEAALRTVESEAGVRGIRIVCGEIEDMEVLGQRLRLEQALVNLLDNALKFNRPGGEVRVQAARTGSEARITIADTGIGIPSADVPRIFERFYRVDKARSREVGGTGLGLSIVRHTVEQMNGRTFVESELGKGSTFTVVLPCCLDITSP